LPQFARGRAEPQRPQARSCYQTAVHKQSLELRVPPVLVVAFFGAVMFTVAFLLPAANVGLPARGVLVGGCAALAVVVVGAGVVAFKQHKTTVNPLDPNQASSLVESGIYRCSRNPMYLGFLFLLVAWSLYLANVAALLALPLFVLYMNRFQIGPEERILSEKFGRAFTEYCASVRRWL
jgi:protein-S-isoprenylcysteine O-methyltransferase Ste14